MLLICSQAPLSGRLCRHATHLGDFNAVPRGSFSGPASVFEHRKFMAQSSLSTCYRKILAGIDDAVPERSRSVPSGCRTSSDQLSLFLESIIEHWILDSCRLRPDRVFFYRLWQADYESMHREMFYRDVPHFRRNILMVVGDYQIAA